MTTLAIVGLGYVGLPLAVAFGKKIRTIGFDLNEKKLANYRKCIDPSGEVAPAALRSAHLLEFTSEPATLAEASIILVVVPTPIDQARRPDLRPLEGACTVVGENMKAGTTVVFESTVYPGCSEEVCVPILEKVSGLKWSGRKDATQEDSASGFYIGYSPERINPGDQVHRLETITKVVSGDTPQTLEKVAQLYEMVVDAGVHRAASIKVAEAAKVIENTQRDLNIALINELALIFHRIGIDTLDVLEAAGTKWNFLPFRPGLVGGHCIGVDPYYLTYKAQSIGYHPEVILAGRRINDDMGKYIAERTVKQLIQRGISVNGATVIILGLTFKEDCPDLRNSRVIDIIRELEDYRCNVYVHDALADPQDAIHEYQTQLTSLKALPPADAVVLAVPHKQYKEMTSSEFKSLVKAGGMIMDVKSILDRSKMATDGIDVWRL